MKTFKTLFVAIVFSISTAIAKSPTIGNLSIYQILSRDNIVSNFGVPSIETTSGKGDEEGQEVSESRYWYSDDVSSFFNISFINYSGRISRAVIKKRDVNYAISGILMIGDPITKINELNYEIGYNYAEYKYLIVNLPVYNINDKEYYYYLRINYDDGIITAIILEESIGI